MTYDRFVMSILERVQKGVGDSVSVSVYTAVKNNGTKKGPDFDGKRSEHRTNYLSGGILSEVP